MNSDKRQDFLNFQPKSSEIGKSQIFKTLKFVKNF